VEEGVDGVEQAPEDVSDGASAHDRAPLHHAAVLYERHLALSAYKPSTMPPWQDDFFFGAKVNRLPPSRGP